jgi:hypothetical protein
MRVTSNTSYNPPFNCSVAPCSSTSTIRNASAPQNAMSKKQLVNQDICMSPCPKSKPFYSIRFE